MEMKSNPISLSKLVMSACAVALFLLLLAIPGRAQQPFQVLHGHVRPVVSSGQVELISPLPSTQKLHVTISLAPRNQATLTSLLEQLYDPFSPVYHHFLSAAQFAQQFAPTMDDYQAVVSFATANGLTVTDQPVNRLVVPLDGTVQQIETAFNVRMNLYRNPTMNRTFYSLDREPSLALSVPVTHITGLDNFFIPHPAVKKGGSPSVPATGSGPGGQYLGSDMRAAYYGGSALTGNGQTVGLFEFDGYDLSDVNLSFSSVGQSYGVPIKNVLLDGATGNPCQFTNPCTYGDVEEVLDIVQAIGMAPSLSQVRVYIGSSDVDIFTAMATEDIAKQISISWVFGDNTSGDDQILQEMALQGQTIFAASGDWGSYPAIHPAFPAEDANVAAVGGTSLTINGTGGSWASETAWSESGGGPSPDGILIPPYQSGLNGVNGASMTLRNAPDVAMEADYDNWVCYSTLGSCEGGWGGTSFAAPRWAGFMALVNQQATAAGNGQGFGLINEKIYPIAESSGYLNDFHDITSGSNGTYSAGSGYDLVTGWGSPNGQNLIDALVAPIETNAAAPQFSNITVSNSSGGSSGGNYTYTIYLGDSTPGATIYYTVNACGNYTTSGSITPGTTSPGQVIVQCTGFSNNATASAYATANGYSTSPTSYASF